VIYGLCPQESADWLYYEYFPQAYAIDLTDFWPVESIMSIMEAIGLVAVTAEHRQPVLRTEFAGRIGLPRGRDGVVSRGSLEKRCLS
jgi:hypothetical protein